MPIGIRPGMIILQDEKQLQEIKNEAEYAGFLRGVENTKKDIADILRYSDEKALEKIMEYIGIKE